MIKRILFSIFALSIVFLLIAYLTRFAVTQQTSDIPMYQDVYFNSIKRNNFISTRELLVFLRNAPTISIDGFKLLLVSVAQFFENVSSFWDVLKVIAIIPTIPGLPILVIFDYFLNLCVYILNIILFIFGNNDFIGTYFDVSGFVFKILSRLTA